MTDEATPHTWVAQPKSWRCSSCLALAFSQAGLVATGCPGVAPAVRDLVHDPRGHKLLVFPNTACIDGFVIGCMRCQRFASALPKIRASFGPGKQCDAVETRHRTRRMERWRILVKGRHPLSGVPLDGDIPQPTIAALSHVAAGADVNVSEDDV